MDVLASIETVMDSDLVHHGRKGQKWGVRNGPPYPLHPEQLSSAEKKARRSVFISGSSKTQFEDSVYYRKELPKAIQNKIDEYMQDHAYIVVGDAPGIDRQVQDYLNEKGYDAVEVYGPGKQVRYTANEKWKTNPVDAPEYEEMSPEWLRKKDIAMTNDATEGLAVVLDEGAKATRNNVERLREQGKAAEVFVLNQIGDDDWEHSKGSYETLDKALERLTPEEKKTIFGKIKKNKELTDEQKKFLFQDEDEKVLTEAGRKVLEKFEETNARSYRSEKLPDALEKEGIKVLDGSYQLNKGAHIRRIAGVGELLDDNRKYASITENDAGEYDEAGKSGILGFNLANKDIYTYEYSTKNKFKIADENQVISYLAEAYGGPKTKQRVKDYLDYVNGHETLDAVVFRNKDEQPKWYELAANKYAREADNLITTMMQTVAYEQSHKPHEGYDGLYDHFEKLGYDAIVDVEDIGYTIELPVVVINPKKSLSLVKSENAFDYSLIDAYNEYKKSNLSHSDFAEFIRPEDLEHHGIKGMKWGHRNGPPYPLDQDTHDKVVQGKDTGVYKKGSKFHRVTFEEHEDMAKTDYKYVTSLKEDRDVYKGPNAIDWMYDEEEETLEEFTNHTIQEICDNFAKRGFKLYEITLEAKTDLKSPSKSERQRMLKELIDEDPTIIDRTHDFFKKDQLTLENREKVKATNRAFDKKRWTRFGGSLSDLAYDPDAFRYFSEALNDAGDIRRQYFDKVKKSGYNMIVDDHDAGSLSERPFIVIDPIETLTQVYAEELSGKSIEKSFRRWERAQDWYTEDEKSFVGHSDFAEFIQPEDLEHHGRKGQKWGVRNGPPYPLKYSKMSPEERQKIPRPKLTKKEEAAYKEQIESKEAATAAKRFSTYRKKRMAEAGLNQNEDGSYTLKEGSNIRRVSSEDDDQRPYAKYVSVTDNDATIYDEDVYELGMDEGQTPYTYEFKAKKDLKIANEDDVLDFLLDKYGNDTNRADVDAYQKQRGKDQIYMNVKHGKAEGWLWDYAYGVEKLARTFVHRELYDTDRVHQREVLDHFSALGYDAIMDIEDRINRFDAPILVIDPESSMTQTRKEKWEDYNLKKSYKNSISHSDFLSHHGVQGQQWGVRHWQNPDGTLTPAGRERWINSLKYEAYQAAKKWEEYQKVRKQVADMHYNGQFDSKLEKQMRDLKEEANKAGAIWGSLRKRVESYLENGPESSTSEPATDAPHKVLVAVGDEERYKHFLDLGYVEKGRNDTWIYMINTDKYIRHSEEIQNDVLAAVEEVIDEDANY